MVILVSQRAVDAVFKTLFLLTDIRGLLRETAPDHVFDEVQKEYAAETIGRIREQISILEEEMRR